MLLSALKQIYSKQNSLQFLKYVCEQNSSTLWLVHEKTLFLNYDCFSDYSLMHNGWNFLKNIKYTSQVVHFMNGCIKAIFIYLQCYVRYIDTELHKWIRRKFLSQTCFVKNHWIEEITKINKIKLAFYSFFSHRPITFSEHKEVNGYHGIFLCIHQKGLYRMLVKMFFQYCLKLFFPIRSPPGYYDYGYIHKCISLL